MTRGVNQPHPANPPFKPLRKMMWKSKSSCRVFRRLLTHRVRGRCNTDSCIVFSDFCVYHKLGSLLKRWQMWVKKCHTLKCLGFKSSLKSEGQRNIYIYMTIKLEWNNRFLGGKCCIIICHWILTKAFGHKHEEKHDFLVGMKCYPTKNNDQQEGTLTKINETTSTSRWNHNHVISNFRILLFQVSIFSTWFFNISEGGVTLRLQACPLNKALHLESYSTDGIGTLNPIGKGFEFLKVNMTKYPPWDVCIYLPTHEWHLFLVFISR